MYQPPSHQAHLSPYLHPTHPAHPAHPAHSYNAHLTDGFDHLAAHLDFFSRWFWQLPYVYGCSQCVLHCLFCTLSCSLNCSICWMYPVFQGSSRFEIGSLILELYGILFHSHSNATTISHLVPWYCWLPRNWFFPSQSVRSAFIAIIRFCSRPQSSLRQSIIICCQSWLQRTRQQSWPLW